MQIAALPPGSLSEAANAHRKDRLYEPAFISALIDLDLKSLAPSAVVRR